MSQKNNWTIENNALHKTFTFKDFFSAVDFINHTKSYIELVNHHPTWENTYNKIYIKLQTHDAGNTLTQKDYDLANYFDQEYEKLFSIA